MFIQIMTLTGVQGFLVVSVLALPAWLMYVGIATSIPLFGAVSAFGAASVLGVPFLLALLGRNEIMVSVWNTAANYYYAGTPYQPLGKLPSGLIGAPIIELNYPFYIKLTQER